MNDPPLQFIDWWLSKATESRQSFLNDPSTSEKVRTNISVLEQYCMTHNYEVFLQSTLRPRPFPRHVFTSSLPDTLIKDEEGNNKLIASTPSFLPEKALIKLPALHANGERFIKKEELVGDASGGVQHYIEGVKSRLSSYLRNAKVLSSSPLYDVGAKIDGLASLMVEVMLESITAALQREQIPVKLEENEEKEEEKNRPRTMRLRGQFLNHQRSDGHVPQRLNSVAKPIAEDLRNVRSLLGVYALLSDPFCSLEEEEEEEKGGKKIILPIPETGRNAGIDYDAWGAIRIAFLESCSSEQPCTNREYKADGFSSCLTTSMDGVPRGDQCQGQFMPSENFEKQHSMLKTVCIQERDVLFAVAKLVSHDLVDKFLEI